MSDQKLTRKQSGAGSKDNKDGAYSYAALADETGKRIIAQSEPRAKVKKGSERRGAMSKKDGNAKGMPGATSQSEDDAFDKARARIAELQSDKDPGGSGHRF